MSGFQISIDKSGKSVFSEPIKRTPNQSEALVRSPFSFINGRTDFEPAEDLVRANFQLRQYQTESIAVVLGAWREFNRVLLVLPTGGEKTVVFAQIAKGGCPLVGCCFPLPLRFPTSVATNWLAMPAPLGPEISPTGGKTPRLH